MGGRASAHAQLAACSSALGSTGTQARDSSLHLTECPGSGHCLLLGPSPALLLEQGLYLILPQAAHCVLGAQLCACVAGCRLQASQQRIMLLSWGDLRAGVEQPRKPWQAIAELM